MEANDKIKELSYMIKEVEIFANYLEDELEGDQRDRVGAVKLSLRDLIDELSQIIEEAK